MELRQQFSSDGFLHLQSVFSESETAKLRRSVENIFSTPSPYAGDINGTEREFSLRINFCARYPELRWVLFHSGLLSPLRALLGNDFIFLPEMAAHASGYGSWHKDTSSQEHDGFDFHKQENFRMIQVAIYLQSNTKSGGGLTVIPGSHKSPDQLISPNFPTRVAHYFKRKARPFLPCRVIYPSSQDIPTKAGDLVLFNFLLDHMATPKRFMSPPALRKFALFFACSANNEHAHAYRQYIQNRETYHYLRESSVYPEDLLELAKRHEVQLML